MTARESKPGDVAMVEDERGTQRIAVRGDLNPRMMHRWHYDEQGMGRIHADPRPLVVIDPEDREQVERLADAYWGRAGHDTADAFQRALREFANPTPVKPEEPTGMGAVVEDADGVLWVRNPDAGVICKWRDATRRWRTYADIAAVRVLSEGVTA